MVGAHSGLTDGVGKIKISHWNSDTKYNYEGELDENNQPCGVGEACQIESDFLNDRYVGTWLNGRHHGCTFCRSMESKNSYEFKNGIVLGKQTKWSDVDEFE